MALNSNKNWPAGGTIAIGDVLMVSGRTLIQTTGDTSVPIGIATNAANTTNPGSLKYEPLEAGKEVLVHTTAAQLTAGDLVAPAASGAVATATHGDQVFAVASETIAASSYGTVVCLGGSYYWAVDN